MEIKVRIEETDRLVKSEIEYNEFLGVEMLWRKWVCM